MKIRKDFVTNSSSSSFILAFDSKEDGLSQIALLTKRFGSDYVTELLSDFNQASPIPYEELRERFDDEFDSEAYHELCFGSGGWWSNDKDTFQKRWMDAHPGADYQDFRTSEEFKTEYAKVKDRLFNELLEAIGALRYLVLVDYEDHTSVGSELEHEILPRCDFTVRSFNHH